jgi:hypothetical protein
MATTPNADALERPLMNEDPRDDWTLLGLAAIAVLAALCIALALPAMPKDDAFDAAPSTSAGEAQWLATEQPGEEMLSRRERALPAAQRADEAELDALLERSEAAVARSRRAAAELEASLRALRPASRSGAPYAPETPSPGPH